MAGAEGEVGVVGVSLTEGEAQKKTPEEETRP